MHGSLALLVQLGYGADSNSNAHEEFYEHLIFIARASISYLNQKVVSFDRKKNTLVDLASVKKFAPLHWVVYDKSLKVVGKSLNVQDA